MDKIIWKGCASGNFRAGRPAAYRPEALVIHIMEGTLTGTDSWFNDAKAQVSAHYGVGKNGEIHQYVKETDTAFHAGIVEPPTGPTWILFKRGVNPNFYTIGIEHEGRAGDIWPDAQYNASIALATEIAARWSIPLDADHVVPHHLIRKTKSCPGSGFDINKYLELAKNAPVQLPQISSKPLNPALIVNILAIANVRSQQPNTGVKIVRVLPVNTQFTATALTSDGERVQGNSIWYADSAGDFLWAGSTDRPQGT